jgi:predicted RNA-binding protein with PUA-like domain
MPGTLPADDRYIVLVTFGAERNARFSVLLGMAYWIVKTEPETHSWQDMVAEKITPWDGVRNYQARNYLRAMELDDWVLVYHSVSDKELVGLARVARTHYPDPTAEEPERWSCVDLRAERALGKPISLRTIKADARFAHLGLVRGGRLSVMPVTPTQFDALLQLAETPLP